MSGDTEDLSILEVVEIVIEKISEAISQLLLMVIDIQKTNAPIPPKLAPAANSAKQASDTLVNTAYQLAEDEYYDFEDIKQEIIEAANEVNAAGENLVQSVQILREAKDRNKHWGGLIDACKIIAEKTILLLRIVYGAEIKKIYAQKEKAQENMKIIDPELLFTNPKEFAQNVSKAAQAANDLAEFLKNKANETKLPLQREALLSNAQALQKQAQTMLNSANEYIKDKTNPKKKGQFVEEMKKLNDLMEKATEPLDQDYAEIKNLTDPNSLNFSSMSPEQFQEALKLETQKHRGKPQLFPKLIEAIKAGDEPLTKELLKDLIYENTQAAEQGKQMAQNVDPHKAKEIMENVNNIEKNLPLLKKAALEAVKNPKDQNKLKPVETFFAEIENAKENIHDITEPPKDRMQHLAEDTIDKLKSLHSAVKDGDIPTSQRLIKDAIPNIQKLCKSAQNYAKDRPEVSVPELNKAIQNINELLPKEVNLLSATLKNLQDEPNKMKFLDNNRFLQAGIEEVLLPLFSNPEKLKFLTDKIEEDLKEQIDDPTNKPLEDLIDQKTKKVQAIGTNVFKTLPPNSLEKKELDNALDHLKKAVPEHVNAVKNYNPKNPKSVDELQSSNKNLGNAVKHVAAATMSPKEQTVFLGKKILADLQDLNEDPNRIKYLDYPLTQSLNTFTPKANLASASLKDPNSKKKVKELTNQIEPLWSQLKKLSANANDKKSLQEAAKANKKLFDVIQAIMDEIGTPSNDIILLGNEAIRNLHDQLSSLPKGQSGVNEKLLKDFDKIIPELLDNTQFSAQNVDDPVRKHKLQHQIETINREKPNYIKAVENAIKNPNNEHLLEKVETAGAPIENAIDQIIETIASPETQLANIANALIDQIDAVEQDIKNEELQGIPQMAQALSQGVDKLACQARVLSLKNPDPVAQEQIVELSEMLENLLPEELESIHDCLRNPGQKKPLEELKIDSQNLREGIRDLLDVSHPTPAQILVASVDQVKDALAKVKDAVEKGDLKEAKEQTNNAQKLFDIITQKAKHLVRDDPIREKQLETTLDKLNEVLKKLPDDVQNGATSKEKPPKQLVDNDVFELTELADEIVDVTGALPLAEAKRLENELKSLAGSVKLDQPKPIATKVRKVADRVATLIPLLEEESKKIKSYDPEKAKNLQDIADLLTEMMPKTAKLTENYLKKPTQPLQTELLDSIGAMEALANEILSGRPKEHQVNPSKNRGKRGFIVGHEELPTPQSSQAVDQIQNLLPQMIKMAQTNDPKLNGLLDDLSNLSDKVKNTSPLRALSHIADKIADRLDKLTMKSLNGKDPTPDINKLQVLLPLLFDGGPNALKLLENPVERKIAETCLENLQKSIPRQINMAKENFSKPSTNIIPIVASLSECDNNLGVISSLCHPDPNEALLDTADLLHKALQAIQEAAPKGDTKRVGEEAKNFENVTPVFLDALDSVIRKLNEPLRGIAKDLATDLINKLNSFPVSLERFQNDPKSSEGLGSEAKDIEQTLSKLMDKINAEPIGLAKRIEANLIKLHNASQAKNVNEIGKLAKALDNDSKALQAIAKKKAEEIKDPQRKKKLLEAIPLLKEGTVLPITAVKNLIKNVNDPLLNMEVVNSIPMVLSPVSTIICALDPTLENQIKEEANNSIANICKAIDALKQKNDPKEQLEQIQKSRDQLSKLLDEKGNKSNDKLKKELQTLMLDYDNLLKDFPQTIKNVQQDPSQLPKAENLAEQMKQALNNIIDTAGNPPDRDDDLIDTKLDGDLILASMKSRGGGKWNAKDLLTAAQELSDCLNDMIDKNRQKDELLENWDDILGMIDNASGREGKKQKNVDDLLDKIYQEEMEKKKKEEEERKKKEEEERKRREEEERKRKEEEERRRKEEENNKNQQISKNTPKTEMDPNSLGGQIGNLANEIESSVQKKSTGLDFSNEPAIKRTLQIAEDLAKMAEAAEKQDQQGVINAGRSVSANINELVKELTQLANQCPDPQLREQMLRDAQGLKNYAIQLKIVASVSAASLNSKGGHDRLVTMAQNFTKSIKGCIEQVSAAKIKMKNKK